MRTILASFIAAGALFVVAGNAAQAQTAPRTHGYCAEFEPNGGWSCNYDTFAQCVEDQRGNGGLCRDNPNLSAAQQPSREGARY